MRGTDWLYAAFWILLLVDPAVQWYRRRRSTRPFVLQSEAATRRIVEGLRPRKEQS